MICAVKKLKQRKEVGKSALSQSVISSYDRYAEQNPSYQTGYSSDSSGTKMSTKSQSKSSTSYSSSKSDSSTSMMTVVNNELGLSIPGYLQIDYAKDIRQRKVLAKGGFGIAYLADALNSKLKDFGNIVVVKVLKKEVMTEKDIKLFQQEVSLMEYFKKERNIAKILGYSENPYAIVMKYYNLGSLSNWFKNKEPKTKFHVLALSHDIASGVMSMHQKGVVHLDLKPDNVLLDLNSHKRPMCVLTDFGISQVITEDIMTVKQFQVAEIRGLSYAYAAPERIMHFRKKIEYCNRDVVFSWDVYSVGIIMFEMLNMKKDVY